MEILHVTSSDFAQKVLQNEKKVILDFWAPWCGPCMMLGGELEKIAAAREDVQVAKVNVDEAPELAAKFRVDSIPAVFLIHEGRVEASTIGYQDANSLLRVFHLPEIMV